MIPDLRPNTALCVAKWFVPEDEDTTPIEHMRFDLRELTTVRVTEDGLPIFAPHAELPDDCRLIWSPSPGYLIEGDRWFSPGSLRYPDSLIHWINLHFCKPQADRDANRRTCATATIDTFDPMLGAYLARALGLRGVAILRNRTDIFVAKGKQFDPERDDEEV